MPWTVVRRSSCGAAKPWAVVNQTNGNVEGCHPTKAKARAQQRALYANEPRASRAAAFNGDLRTLLARIEEKYLAAITLVYETALHEAARFASDKFALTAAASDWQPPAEGALLSAAELARLASQIHGKADPFWRGVIIDLGDGLLARIGISWTAKEPLVQQLVDRAGSRVGARLGQASSHVLRETVTEAYDQGLNVRDTSALIRTRLSDAAPWQADMLARTDLNSLSNGASKLAAERVGMSYKTWLATLDDKTRPTHADAHGQTVPINDTFTVGGESADYPGDPNLSDAEAANCRCTLGYGETLGEADALLADAGGSIMAKVKTRQRKRQHARRTATTRANVAPATAGYARDGGGAVVEALVAGAVAVHHTGVVTGTWDGNAAMGRCSSAADYRSICAAFETGADLSQRQAWHLPHHANPGGPANINGVRNGLSRAPQTTSISPADRAGATAHLRAHLNDYNKRQGANAIAGFEALSDEDALAALDRVHGPVEIADELAASMPAGVKACSLGGKSGYSGGGLCYTHDGSQPSMDKAMQRAKADAAKRKGGMARTAAAQPIGFSGIAAIENLVSDDNSIAPRVLLANSLSWPEMPVSFMAQTVTAEQHDGAQVAGRVDKFARKRSTGRMQNIETAGELTTPFGVDEVAPMLADKTMRYVSADLGASEWGLVDRQTLKAVPQDEFDIAAAMDGAYALGCASAKIKGLTLVTTQAIEGAMVALTASADAQGIAIEELGEEALLACATTGSWSPPPEKIVRIVVPADGIAMGGEGLVAAATPRRPPRGWFEVQEPPGKMPLTVQEDGQVYGHLATWDSCHVSFLPSCVPPPRSASNYAYFHVSELDTDQGVVTVGKLMFSPTDGGHADRGLTAQKASQYYDRTGMTAAFLRVVDGRFGIWACGSINPKLNEEQREEMRCELRANPPSGDWRPINGQYELICGLAVAVPGFPVPREGGAKVTVVASADGVEMQDALIFSSGAFDPDPAALAALGLVDEDAEAERDMLVRGARASGGLEAMAALLEEGGFGGRS